MLPIGGSWSQETSVCQPSPLARGESLSAWMIISSGLAGACGAAGWMCNSPNKRPKARCWSSVRCWSRKKMTRFSASAVELVEGAVAERPRQVDAADLGADDRRQLLD